MSTNLDVKKTGVSSGDKSPTGKREMKSVLKRAALNIVHLRAACSRGNARDPSKQRESISVSIGKALQAKRLKAQAAVLKIAPLPEDAVSESEDTYEIAVKPKLARKKSTCLKPVPNIPIAEPVEPLEPAEPETPIRSAYTQVPIPGLLGNSDPWWQPPCTCRPFKFSEDPVEDPHASHSVRSPSRLGYTQDIPTIIETSFDSKEDLSDKHHHSNDRELSLDLHQISTEQEADSQQSTGNKQLLQRLLDYDTREFGQQTDFPSTPASPVISASDPQGHPTHQFVSSKLYFSDQGRSPKHPYEKTVFYVKKPLIPVFERVKPEPSLTHSVTAQPSAKSASATELAASSSGRVDSGYNSRQETIRIPSGASARQAARDTSLQLYPAVADSTPKMNIYQNDLYSPTSSARKQEKEDLQQLHDRFTLYIQKVRQQNHQQDAASFLRQTKVLEEEVTTLKNLYERELESVRQELDGVSRERSSLQIQCHKNKQIAMDFESRLSVEADKSRRMQEEYNTVLRKVTSLETEIGNLQGAGQPVGDFQALQRELDKLVRENEDLKRRHDQETVIRAEAEDRCHTLTKKLEFNEQVNIQQTAELRQRLEQTQATIISLESRVRDLSKADNAIPELLKQVRETSEHELRQYQMESEENYNRNIAALKAQMDNDAQRIEQLNADKAQLIGQNGELQARVRNMEGQLQNMEHQKVSVENLLQQERDRSTEQIHMMEKKIRDMQEIVFTHMREANSARDSNIPLKVEIDALKALLVEEERRLQVPIAITTEHQQQTSYVSSSHQTSASQVQAANVTQNYMPVNVSQTQALPTVDSPFITQAAAGHGSVYPPDRMSPVEAAPLTPTAPPEPEGFKSHESVTFDADAAIDTLGTQKYTYECTPSVNRLQIGPSPQMTPRAVGPVSRVKSAPAGTRNGHLVPTALGHGKDYFDEMFKDLYRETLYTNTRPKSSPMRKPDDQASGDQTRERPKSSVFHDYTTATSSSVGDVKILEVNPEGKFVRLSNEGKQEVEFGGYMIQQNVGGHPVAVFRFPPRSKFAENSTITVWAGCNDALLHEPPKDFVWKEQMKWGTGPECTTILCKPNGQAIAWTTAAHRFTRNAFEETSRPTSDLDNKDVETDAMPVTREETLTEMNVNLNEPKPEPVYLRREKQCPPSLAAPKHPHGTSPGRETHPHTGQPRPQTYGNDNSSVNRQSRSQSTRPDPIQGQPYAGSNRLGSAPHKKMNASTNGNIRGSGALANRSDAGVTSPPPSPFQTPHRRFEKGLSQIKSQHHQDYLPPMPRPPLFSAW